MAEESGKQGAGMKELIEKTVDQLIELVVLLPAGGILLASIVWFWLDPDIVPPSVHSLFGDSSAKLVVTLIAASALGLLMFGWAAEGADAYLASVGRPRRWAVRLFHWMPVPPVLRSPRVQSALESMANDYTGVEALGRFEHDADEPSRHIWPGRYESSPGPWRSVARFTVLVDHLRPRTYAFRPREEPGALPPAAWQERSEPHVDGPSQAWSAAELTYIWSITGELRNLHLRVVLTLSVALALAVTAVEVVLRLGIGMLHVVRLPLTSQNPLIAIGVTCVLSSIGLRFLAGRLWREELELALLLYERITLRAKESRDV